MVLVSNLCITTCDYNTLAKSTTKFSERFFLVLVSDAKEELCKVLYSFSKMSGRKTFEAQLIEKWKQKLNLWLTNYLHNNSLKEKNDNTREKLVSECLLLCRFANLKQFFYLLVAPILFIAWRHAISRTNFLERECFKDLQQINQKNVDLKDHSVFQFFLRQ